MNISSKAHATIILLLNVGGMACFAGDGPTNAIEVGIESGTAVFESTTNMPGIEVKGKSTALTGRVSVAQDGNNLVLQGIDASLPVSSLATGMKVRDEHMRKYIFTTADGREPDLHFTAENGSCPGSSRQFACQLTGQLTIRGVTRPAGIRLKVKQPGGPGTAFHVEGDGLVKRSDYGIPPPSQFGVKPSNEVKLHLEFAGKSKSLTASDGHNR